MKTGTGIVAANPGDNMKKLSDILQPLHNGETVELYGQPYTVTKFEIVTPPEEFPDHETGIRHYRQGNVAYITVTLEADRKPEEEKL